MTMPWSLTNSLPLIRYAMPVRFSNYAFLTLAIILSIWLSGPEVRFGRALGVAVIIGLFPNPLFLFQQSRYEMPPFFTQGLYRGYLKSGENVLVIPYGFDGPSMVWQAETSMYFRMPGGYIGVITPADFGKWPLLSMLTNLMPVPDAAQELRAFLATYRVDTIAVAESASGPASELPASLGLRAVKVGGVSLYQVPREFDADPSRPLLTSFQQATVNEWFSELLCAARTFVTSGHRLADLSPAKAHELGLLPDSKWSRTLDQAVAARGALNGLWIGAGENGTIAVGLPAWPAAFDFLLSRYGSDATSILYPYPLRYSKDAPSDDAIHYLLMTLRSTALTHCGQCSGAGHCERPP